MRSKTSSNKKTDKVYSIPSYKTLSDKDISDFLEDPERVNREATGVLKFYRSLRYSDSRVDAVDPE